MDEKAESILESTESLDFDIFSCIDFIRRHASEIGVQFHLLKKLRTYKYEDIEFLIPQLLQILISFETDSMALEGFILEYCELYPHFSLIVFWNLQAYIFELKDSPDSYSFQTVRSLINKLQDVLFNPNALESTEFRENIHPAMVLCGAIAASFGLPRLHEYTSPIIRTQAKQQKSFVFKLANFQKTLTRNLTLKNQKLSNESRTTHSDEEGSSFPKSHPESLNRHSESSARTKRRSTSTLASDDSELYTSDEDDTKSVRKHRATLLASSQKTENLNMLQSMEERMDVTTILKKKPTPHHRLVSQQHLSQSLPDLNKSFEASTANSSELDLTTSHRDSSDIANRNSEQLDRQANNPEKCLRVNYAKSVTDFMIALQNISLRLSQVPKEARLSALRAELSIINDTILPSEIDIPQLLPITSTRKRYHKLLKLSVNEACCLNSAERVPFLMFVEFLSDEIDFNPSTTQNQMILKRLSKNDKNITRTEAKLSSEEEIKESEKISDALMQVEADLSDLRVSSVNSSNYDLTSLEGSHLKILDSADHKKNSQADPSAKKRADQMRIAAVMLQQLESSGQATTEQSAAIKERIVKSMIALQDQFDGIDYDKFIELGGDEANAGERKLENDFKLAEDWKAKKQRIRSSSVYGHLPNWDLCSVIAKNGSDLPQEAFACQLIGMISNIWAKKRIPYWTKRMKIVITSANTGLVETITNAISVHSIKKSLTEISIANGENTKRRIFTLKDYFEKLFGGENSVAYKRAQENFMKSLASYSIICYLLQIKDRHNGNIMVDNEGHIIHIDFGFLLSNSPGSVGFEAAPFKLNMEYVELLGGLDSSLFEQFRTICKDCFLALREESSSIINMVEIMQKDSSLPCFNNGENTSVLLKQRLQLHLNESEACEFVETSLIGKSLGSMYTRLYDQFQLITQGIYS